VSVTPERIREILETLETPEKDLEAELRRRENILRLRHYVRAPQGQNKKLYLSPQDRAYLKGFRAAAEGKKRKDCPYYDFRTFYRNSPTFSRGFINAWNRGYDDGVKWMRGEPGSLVVDYDIRCALNLYG